MRKRILFLILILIFSFSFLETANAVSGNLNISGNTSVTVGNTVKLTLTYSGNSLFGGKTFVTISDTSILSITGDPGKGNMVSVNPPGTNYFWRGSDSGSSSLYYTITFKANKAGTVTITFASEEVCDSEGNDISIGNKTYTITVKDPEKSGDANLSNITVSQGELYPSFAYNITSYTATVEYKTEEVVVGYKTSNGNASAKISGSNKLNVGDNKRTITVTAENGSTKTYTVNIIRAQEDGTLPDGTNYYDIKKQNALGITIDEKEYMILDDFKGIRVPDGFNLDVVSYNEFDIPVIVAKKTGIKMGYITPVDTNDASVKAKWMFFDEIEKSFTDNYSISSDEVLDQTKYLLFGDDEPDEPEPEPAKPESLLDDPVLLYTILGTLAVLFIVILILQFSIISSKSRENKKKAKKETPKKEVSE